MRFIKERQQALETIQLLQRETSEIIATDLWPPNSPDLNPVDCRIWAYAATCIQDSRQ